MMKHGTRLLSLAVHRVPAKFAPSTAGLVTCLTAPRSIVSAGRQAFAEPVKQTCRTGAPANSGVLRMGRAFRCSGSNGRDEWRGTACKTVET